MKTHFLLPAAALVLLPAAFLLAQGPLAPPAGPPTPTIKTLDQVQPRTPIDDSHTPGDATNLFRIAASGSYYLTGSITGASGKNGILVDADDVTIDLCGFLVAGGVGTLNGVSVADGHARLTLRNGTISGWENHGVSELDGSGSGGTYENLRIIDNGVEGLQLGEKAMVTSCIASSNGNAGIAVDGGTISRCTASGNSAFGIAIHKGVILDSVVSGNGFHGIYVSEMAESAGSPVLIQNCVAFENGETGIQANHGSRIDDCISRQNGLGGIRVKSTSTVTRCTVKNNVWGITAEGSCHIAGNMCEGNGEGIITFNWRNHISENDIVNGGTGIKVTSPGSNLIICNTVGNNTTNYDILADNRYGPILDITSGGTPAVTGDSGTDTTNTTHPWANFSY